MKAFRLVGVSLVVGLALAELGAEEPQTIHVETTGSQNGDGSREHPFDSVRQGIAALRPGWRLALGSGTWREGELRVDVSGTVDQPIEIVGAGPAETLILGSQALTNWQPVGDGIWELASWSINTQQVLCDGVPLKQLGSASVWHKREVWAGKVALEVTEVQSGASMPAGAFYFDAANKRLRIKLADLTDPNTHHMEAGVAPWLLRGTGSHVRIRNIGFMHASGSALTHGMLVSCGPEDWQLENCLIALGDMWGLNAGGRGHVIRNCVIRDHGGLGISINNSDEAHNWDFYADAPTMGTRIEGCEVSGNNYRGFYAAWHAGGLKGIPAVRGLTVVNCRVVNNAGPGIWFDHCLGDNVIENNIVTGNGHGIFYEISVPGKADTTGALIRNNLVYGNSSIGVYVSASESITVERNTLYGNWANLVLHGMPRNSFRLRNNRATKNILGGGSHADLVLFVGEGAADNVVEQNFYAIGPAVGETDDSKRIRAAIVQGSGFDVRFHSIETLNALGLEFGAKSGNPQFVDVEAHNFRLREESAAMSWGWEPKADRPRAPRLTPLSP